MKNQALIQEVITQLSPKFAPKIPDIKKVGKRNHSRPNSHWCHSLGHRYTDGEGVHRTRAKYARHIRLHGLTIPSSTHTLYIARVSYFPLAS